MVSRFAMFILLADACLGQDTARMDKVVQSYAANLQFMGSVLVARGSEVLFTKGYGSANLEWDIPNSPATKFRLGSITKQFTAASVLLLEERGKLLISDPVKKHLPDAPAAWDKITLFHLLTHTSGIPNFTSLPDYATLEPLATTAEQSVARFRDRPLDFEPGATWSYSNSGYVLLGYLIEKISGGSYEKFVRENIFIPLGMTDSGYDSNSAIIPHRASGYMPTSKGFENAGFIHMSVPHSAGALYSTTGDLLKWEQGLFGGKLLRPASLEKMTSPFKRDYAFGLQVATAGGRKVFEHGGGIAGFSTELAYYPDDKLTVVALGNLSGQAPGEIARKLAAVVHGETVELQPEHKEIKVARQILEQYVGVYALRPGLEVTFSMEGDQMMTQMTGQPKFPVFAESETRFFLKLVDAQVEFVKNAQGAVTRVLIHQAGRDATALRK
jgi:CubicO group peptidase (beta-lactamase class C family)